MSNALERKTNPEPFTIGLIVVVVVAVVVGIVATVRARNKPQPVGGATNVPPDGGVVPGPSIPPGGPSLPPGGGDNLPSGMNVNDAAGFQTLGYGILGRTVERFQQDFNIVNAFLSTAGQEMLPITLAEDNIMGPLTRQALDKAIEHQTQYAQPWSSLVEQARG